MSETFETLNIHLFSEKFTPERRTTTLTYDGSHDIDSITPIVASMVNAGWTVGAVDVTTDYDRNGTATVVTLDSISELMEFLEVLQSEDYDATRILAYGELYGWDIDNYRDSRYGRKYEDSFFIMGDSRADVAQEYHSEFTDFDETKEQYNYLVIDWDRTADQMSMAGHNFHERNGLHMILDAD